jgi:magnesium transporter
MIVNSIAYRHGRRLGEIRLEDISEVLQEPGAWVWLGIHEPDLELLRRVQEEFGLHELAIEDALNAHQRPKIEAYGDSLFIVVETAQLVGEEVRFGETHVFLGANYVVSIRHGASVSYAAVREKCEAAPQRLRLGPAFAAYAIIDFVVDNYQPVAERLRAAFEGVESRLFDESFDNQSIRRLYHLKAQLLKLREALAPIHDICGRLVRVHEALVHKELRPYLRDVEDHVTRTVSSLDNLSEMLTTAIQMHLALVTVGQNEVVKRLAGWGAILAVPTVVFSLYGMNFRFMPELAERWAYPAVLGGTLCACALLYWRLRKAAWI